MKYTYIPKGVCSNKIEFDINDKIISNVKIYGGCPGNAIGVSKLVEGKSIDEIYNSLKGVRCGNKPTSCPDQLAIAIMEAYNNTKKQ